MKTILRAILRPFLLGIGRVAAHILFRISIDGRQHLPANPQRLIVISNHFSWYDAGLLTLLLPFQPSFLVATESRRKWWVRGFMFAFDGIPIWRGQVDRDAFRAAEGVLSQDGVLGVFPEGGIDPVVAEAVARGETVMTLQGHTSRTSATLTYAKPGTALLAINSGARILPVGLLGTETIGANLRRLRRTALTVRIGPIFGPLTLDSSVRGRERRKCLESIAHDMMQNVADLFPVEQRGPYRRTVAEPVISR